MTSRPHALGAAIVIVVVAILGVIHAGHGPSLGADDHGQYLLHARALLDGRPYTDIGFIHTAYSTLVAPIAEPPGLPALIAAAFAIGGERFDAARPILWLALALGALLAYRYWARAAGWVTGTLVATWTLVALGRQHAADTMLADLPFLAALWLAFAAADGDKLRGVSRTLVLAAAGVLAFTFRMAALPLLPAAATALLLRGREERGALAIALVAWTAAAVAVMYGLPAAEVLSGETIRSPAVLFDDLLLNARATWDGARTWVPLWLPWRGANLALHTGVLGVAVVGAVVAVREHPRRFASITAVWYLLMLAALPTRASRYLWPLFPIMAFTFVRGARWILDGVRPGATARSPGVAPAIGLALVAAGLAQDALAPVPPTFTRLADMRAVREVLAREDAGQRRLRVMVFSPRVMAWETGYTTMALFDAANDEMLRVMQEHGITHVVTGDAGTYAIGTAGADRLVRERPGAFDQLLRTPTFAVFRVIPAGQGGID